MAFQIQRHRQYLNCLLLATWFYDKYRHLCASPLIVWIALMACELGYLWMCIFSMSVETEQIIQYQQRWQQQQQQLQHCHRLEGKFQKWGGYRRGKIFETHKWFRILYLTGLSFSSFLSLFIALFFFQLLFCRSVIRSFPLWILLWII